MYFPLNLIDKEHHSNNILRSKPRKFEQEVIVNLSVRNERLRSTYSD